MRHLAANITITEPFESWAWPSAYAWAERCRSMFADGTVPSSLAAFVESNSVRFRSSRTFGLWKDGTIGGVVILEPASPHVVTAHILLSKRLWGIPAVQLQEAARLAFEADPALIRIQAFVPAWNRLAIALCLRLGASLEGTLRSATLRNGKPADAVVMALTREDWNGIESRRIRGRNNQFVNGQLANQQHVQPDPGDDAGRDRNGAAERPGGIERGNALARNAGDGNERGQPDQLDIGGGRGNDGAEPRVARLRGKRANGAGKPAKRTRPRGRSGS